MKVLQVIDKLDVGGAERVSIDLAILLSRQPEVTVSFLCLLDKGELDFELNEKNIELLNLKRPSRYHLKSFIRLVKILNQYDIIHVHSRHVLRYVGLTHFLPSYLKKYKIVFHDHYGNIENDPHFSNYMRFCISRCKAYIGVSQTLISWAKKIDVKIPLFLLSNIILKPENQDIKKKTASIIVVGNFRKQKNYEFLIELMDVLPHEICVDIYGKPVDIHYYEFIVNLIEKKKLGKRIRIFTNEKNVLPLLNNYKLALHCAKSETGPLVCIEYLSKKIPFLMYETGEVSKQVKTKTDALTMGDFDLENWNIQIMKLIYDVNYRAEVINDMVSINNIYYSEEKYVQKCLKIYHTTLSS
jgi:glycosyltransferase involved in cell wall biosynthesis